jgi:hypothetical protein
VLAGEDALQEVVLAFPAALGAGFPRGAVVAVDEDAAVDVAQRRDVRPFYDYELDARQGDGLGPRRKGIGVS